MTRCSKQKKANCKDPCTWIRGSGCKSTLKPIREKKPGSRGGCRGIRKANCKIPCNWVKNKGCSKSLRSKSPKSSSAKSLRSKSPKSSSAKSLRSKSPKSSSAKFSLKQPYPSENSPRYEEWKKWFVNPLFKFPPKNREERKEFSTHYTEASLWLFENDPELYEKFEQKWEDEDKRVQALIPSKAELRSLLEKIFRENQVLCPDKLLTKIVRNISEQFEDMSIFKFHDLGIDENVKKFIRDFFEDFIEKGKIGRITKELQEDIEMYFNNYVSNKENTEREKLLPYFPTPQTSRSSDEYSSLSSM